MNRYFDCLFSCGRRRFHPILLSCLLCTFLFFLTLPGIARDIVGVKLEEMLINDEGTQLHLNGAGIRVKFFFKIYVGALYMEHPSREVSEVIDDTGAKRMVMHFLYDEVPREKLVDAWNDGFEKNSTAEQKAFLQNRINQFNNLFSTVKKGDTIILDYQPNRGTTVVIGNKKTGVVPGKDFNDALLLIWLGNEPVTGDLKDALLNYSPKKHLR